MNIFKAETFVILNKLILNVTTWLRHTFWQGHDVIIQLSQSGDTTIFLSQCWDEQYRYVIIIIVLFIIIIN